MRIGIDATWAGVVGTGTGSYTLGLVQALVQHREHEFVLYMQRRDMDRNPLLALASDNVRCMIVEGYGQLGRTLLGLSSAAARDRLDVFHSPGYFLPLWTGPKVVTFHDVNMFLQWDKWWRPGMRVSWLSLSAQTVLASRTARTVVADSQDARTSIQRVLRIAGHRMRVLYPGVNDVFFADGPWPEADGIRCRYELDDYALFVSVLSPQKNLDGVVRAFAEVRSQTLKLVIVGREDGGYFERVIRPLILKLGLAESVTVLGVVSLNALPGLYAGARAFMFPSFAEGFGLPPLEAMASGTAVVASNRSSLPEVLGEAALLVDPFSVTEIAAALSRLLYDDVLRRELVRRGRDRAGLFRWQSSAEEALKIYDSAA